MKRLGYILIVLMIFGLFVSGCESVIPRGDLSRGTLKVAFTQINEAQTEGFVIVNRTPNGATETTVQIQIWNAHPNALYRVRTPNNVPPPSHVKIGEFYTNKQGKGHIHLNLPSDTDLGGWMGVFYVDPDDGMVKELEAKISE